MTNGNQHIDDFLKYYFKLKAPPLSKLKDEQIIKRCGATKNGYWEVLDE